MPDLAGWRIERMPELPDTAYFTVAPDWVCEVPSRSTEKIDTTVRAEPFEALELDLALLWASPRRG